MLLGIVLGAVIGFIVGALISYNLVLPPHISFAAINASDLVSILGALLITFFFTVIGSILGSILRKPRVK